MIPETFPERGDASPHLYRDVGAADTEIIRATELNISKVPL